MRDVLATLQDNRGLVDTKGKLLLKVDGITIHTYSSVCNVMIQFASTSKLKVVWLSGSEPKESSRHSMLLRTSRSTT